MTENRRIVLASRPQGAPTSANFRLETAPMPQPGEGQILLKTLFLSLDPYMRGRMNDTASYAAPVGIGEVMTGEVVGRVEASRAAGFAPGDLVAGRTGWQEWAIGDAGVVRKLAETGSPPSTALGVLGMPSMTAWVGMHNIGQPKAGETVVVAAASGPVGSMVGQIAKLRGARAVGIAGGADKCAYVTGELGFDACVDHRDPALGELLAQACPKGIDVYFENVNGAVWDAVFPLLNPFARVPVCGLVANYNMTDLPPGPDRTALLFRAALTKRLRIQGFLVYDFADQEGDFIREIAPLVKSGAIKHREDISQGLASAPETFIGMLTGGNFGKTLVHVAD
ncbi:MAG: NADP-dependent oxidoreductase [Janthinobacterium lividum]